VGSTALQRGFAQCPWAVSSHLVFHAGKQSSNAVGLIVSHEVSHDTDKGGYQSMEMICPLQVVWETWTWKTSDQDIKPESSVFGTGILWLVVLPSFPSLRATSGTDCRAQPVLGRVNAIVCRSCRIFITPRFAKRC